MIGATHCGGTILGAFPVGGVSRPLSAGCDMLTLNPKLDNVRLFKFPSKGVGGNILFSASVITRPDFSIN